MSCSKLRVNKFKSKLYGAVALCWLGWAAQAAQAQTLSIGIVDEEKLGQSYTKYKNAVSDIEKRAQSLDERLAGRLLLTADEGKKFDELISKASRSAGEEAELKKLAEAGTGRQAEYNGLIGKAAKSDDDTKRIKSLEGQAEANKAGMEKISNDLYSKMKQEQESTDKKYTDLANNVIKQVAEEKKLALVVRKVAVIWSAATTDITDDVLKKLNG